MIYPKRFEVIDVITSRLKIRGGWIVRSYSMELGVSGGAGCSIHTIFIPDSTHQWKLEE